MKDKIKLSSAPDISIIVCNYNYNKYIGDALESIKCQSLKNWECIIIDDASTDNSMDIINKYVHADPRFRCIQMKTHGGVSIARNAGLDDARGEYIAFLDSDDCFTEYALEMLLHIAKTTGADMAGGAANTVPDTFRFIPTGKQSWNAGLNGAANNPAIFLLAPAAHKWCWLWRRIYRRDFIGKTRFIPDFTTFGDDLTFMLDICYRANAVIETQNVSVYHRRHAAAITTSQFDPHFFDWFPKYFQHIRENLLDKYDGNFWRAFYRNTFGYLLLETVFKPKQYGEYVAQARATLIASCKQIPRRYLTPKQRFLCWFFTCLKK